jgi:glycosyltransferase involved in cell wall biosynthesis
LSSAKSGNRRASSLSFVKPNRRADYGYADKDCLQNEEVHLSSNEPKPPLVTIGMPVRNGEDHLREALNSLLAQEFQGFAILISDNASEDQTEVICREFEQIDKRVHYARRPSEVPVYTNFFDLVNKCESQYFMWAAHDDIWSQNWLLSLVNLLRNQDKASGAFGALMHVDCNGQEMNLHPANGATFEKLDTSLKTKRFMSYLHSDPARGKANLLYSLFRTSTLKQAIGIAQQKAVDYDCAIVSGVLWDGYIASTSKATFSKRICSRLSEDTEEAATKPTRRTSATQLSLPLRIRRRVKHATESHNELLQYLLMSRGSHSWFLTRAHYVSQVFVIIFSFINIVPDLKSLYANRKI